MYQSTKCESISPSCRHITHVHPRIPLSLASAPNFQSLCTFHHDSLSAVVSTLEIADRLKTLSLSFSLCVCSGRHQSPSSTLAFLPRKGEFWNCTREVAGWAGGREGDQAGQLWLGLCAMVYILRQGDLSSSTQQQNKLPIAHYQSWDLNNEWGTWWQ